MKIIRTVLGDIPASEIGKTDSHDHLIRSGGPEVVRNPMFLMDDTAAAKREFGAFLASGGKTMVCMDPIGCGRNVGKMAEIAEAYRGQGNLVMVTGFHKAENYDPRVSFLATVDEKKIAALMCLEITDGMDLHSYREAARDCISCLRAANAAEVVWSWEMACSTKSFAVSVFGMTPKCPQAEA